MVQLAHRLSAIGSKGASSGIDPRIVARVANFKMDQLLLYFYAMPVTLTRVAHFHAALFAENRVLIREDADA